MTQVIRICHDCREPCMDYYPVPASQDVRCRDCHELEQRRQMHGNEPVQDRHRKTLKAPE